MDPTSVTDVLSGSGLGLGGVLVVLILAFLRGVVYTRTAVEQLLAAERRSADVWQAVAEREGQARERVEALLADAISPTSQVLAAAISELRAAARGDTPS